MSNSLQARLSIGLTLLFCLFLLLASTGAIWVLRHELNELLDSAMAETGQRILPLAVVEIINRNPQMQASDSVAHSIVSLTAHDEHLTYLVVNRRDEVLLKSHNADTGHFNLQQTEGFEETASHRVYAVSAVSGDFRILIAETLAHRRQALWESMVALIWPMLLLVPLCFAGVWWFVRHRLQHVVAYRNAVMARHSHHLETIHIEGMPDELESICESVNHLLITLNQALSAQRSFTANSAHELRTPISTALAQLQLLKKNLTKPENIQRAEQLERTIKEQARLSEKLMQLAKAEGGNLILTQSVDVIPVVQLLVHEYQLKTTIPLRLSLPRQGCLMLKIDTDAFAVLLRNLLENAIKYAEPEAGIDIKLSGTGQLSVINDCEALPVALLQRLNEPFVRAVAGGIGQGLGLAIVQAIVNACNARMQLFSPIEMPQRAKRERGFEVRIQFSL